MFLKVLNLQNFAMLSLRKKLRLFWRIVEIGSYLIAIFFEKKKLEKDSFFEIKHGRVLKIFSP